MKLADFIQQLLALEEKTPGALDMEVYYRHGSSGDCGELSSARVATEVNDCGPFDLEDGARYVSIYAGN